jgi:hypothetical protein
MNTAANRFRKRPGVAVLDDHDAREGSFRRDIHGRLPFDRSSVGPF